jgi:uncharacterized RDD family membrane protein YckC
VALSPPGGRTFVVRTPEGVFFRYELTGPVERVFAYLFDAALMAGLLLGAVVVLGRLGRLGTPLVFVAFFLIQWGYFLFFEWRQNGSTPGKRIFGIRVIQRLGVRCSLERLVLRNFLRVVDSLPFLYGIGGVVALLNRHGQRLGDLAAGTLLVRLPKPPPPRALADIRTRFNSLRDDPAARARIRERLAPREVELVTGLALRRDLLAREARLELFARTAAYLRRRLRLLGHEGLPDERLVLNVAAVLLEEREL